MVAHSGHGAYLQKTESNKKSLRQIKKACIKLKKIALI